MFYACEAVLVRFPHDATPPGWAAPWPRQAQARLGRSALGKLAASGITAGVIATVFKGNRQ
jgi:hypothetical protein